MLWRIEFVQSLASDPGYLGVAHYLQDTEGTRKIVDLRVSPEEYEAGTFEREPRRLEMEFFADEWVWMHILEGDNEYERNISHYLLRVYKDEVLFFTGIIDTSALTVDRATSLVGLTAYAPDRLFALFDDLEAQYSLSAGYTVRQLFALHVNMIRGRVGVPIPFNTMWFERPDVSVNINEPLVVADFEYGDLAYLPPNAHGCTYNFVDLWGPRWGWFLEYYTQVPAFMMVQIVTIKAAGPDQYYMRFRARLARVFNHVCAVVEEYDANTGWVAAEEKDEKKNLAINDLDKWMRQWGVNYAQVDSNPGLPHQYMVGDAGYGYGYEPGVRVTGTFYGRLVPEKIHPGRAVLEATSAKTNVLDVLRAVMYMNRATITSDAEGALYLRSVPQEATGEPLVIANADVLEMDVTRSDYESDADATLDVLAGGANILAEQVQAWHDGLQRGRWEAEAVVAGDYEVALGQKIRLRGDNWMVTSVEHDMIADTRRVRAWKLQQ